MNEMFWSEDLSILFKKHDIWPGVNTPTRVSKLNAISRFIILYFVILSIYHKSITPISIGGVLLIMIAFMEYSSRKKDDPYNIMNPSNINNFNVSSENKQTDSKIFNTPYISSTGSVQKPLRGIGNAMTTIDHNICRKPDNMNLFGNPNIGSIETSQYPSCSKDSNTYNAGFDMYSRNEYSDIFDTHSRRQFYSVINNDQSKFANFLYKQ
tara:strand:- start:36 stop:665 length:630 start_codon:yes stop_codon:yes gene_type:complete